MKDVRCAIVANTITPYRVLFHGRISAETPGMELHTLITHARAALPWATEDSGLRNVVRFEIAERPGERVAIGREIRALLDILAYVRANQIEVVIVNGYDDLVRLGLITVLSFRRIPVLMAADSNDFLEDLKPLWKRTVKRLLLTLVGKRLSAVLAMGDSGMRYFERYMSTPPPIFKVPYDIDVSRFGGRSLYDHHRASAEFGLDPRSKHFLFVGRLVQVKGIDILLDAFVDVARHRSDWDLAIAGVGPLDSHLRNQVPPDIKDRVHWLGFVDHDVLPRLYAACDVLVMPSLEEPWGIVATEALSSGVPVISTDVAGAPMEIIANHGGGVIVPRGDCDALTAALIDVADASDLDALRVGASSAFGRWRSECDPVQMVQHALEAVASSTHKGTPDISSVD